MQVLKSSLLFIVFFFALLVFVPKQNVYYLVEKELKRYNVVISNEEFSSQLLGFTLKDASLYVNDVNIAKLNNVRLSLNNINITSKEIGDAKATVDVMNQSINVYFEPTKTFIKKYKIVLKYFKKQQDGVYKYEYKL